LLAFCGSRISEHMAQAKNGALICMGVPIARDGDQQYRPEELGVTSSAQLITVHRPASEVFDKAAMASFEGCALCDSHPGQFVQPTNWRAHASGHCQNIREGPRLPSGERTLVADLVIADSILKEKVLSGLHRDVSCAYSCEYVPLDDGTFAQTNIRGNHIAVCAVGRGGANIRIYDSSGGTMSEPTTIADAIARLDQLIALLERSPRATQDAEFDRRLSTIDSTPEAFAFCEAANALGRKMRGVVDCRPALRQRAEDAREVEEDPAVEFAAAAKKFHRK
jgi:hypothetical protein